MDEIEAGFWGILELMGHVRLGGYVTEEEKFGSKVGRIDIPQGDKTVTQFFGGGSIYRLTVTTEDVARAVAAHHEPRPIEPYEFQALISNEGVGVRADWQQ